MSKLFEQDLFVVIYPDGRYNTPHQSKLPSVYYDVGTAKRFNDRKRGKVVRVRLVPVEDSND